MKNLYLLISFLFIFNSMNGQINKTVEELDAEAKEYFDSLYPTVFINKNLVAYTTMYSKKINGIEYESKMNNPNLKNPYKISINSNKNGGMIIIQNKYMTEDIVIDFQDIVILGKDDKGASYLFNTKSDKIEAHYSIINGGHNMLFIIYNSDANNSETMTYVISRI